jgi:hypothetical protein
MSKNLDRPLNNCVNNIKNLGEYIDWHQSLNFDETYDIYPKLADPSVTSFLPMGKIDLPELITDDGRGFKPDFRGTLSQYTVLEDESLLKWAAEKFPKLKFLKCRMQVQKPGEAVRAHLDLLGDYLKNVSVKMPWIRKTKHSFKNPRIDIHQYIIACDDQVEGQVFGFENPGPWQWKKGDYIRVNTWQALHWTENKSEKDRAIIKVQGINFGMKKELNVFS